MSPFYAFRSRAVGQLRYPLSCSASSVGVRIDRASSLTAASLLATRCTHSRPVPSAAHRPPPLKHRGSTSRTPASPARSAHLRSTASSGSLTARLNGPTRAPPRSKPAAAAAPEEGEKKLQASSLRGRFNRLAADKGFAFATYLYILGEGMTTTLTLWFHWNSSGWEMLDVRYWLCLAMGVSFVEMQTKKKENEEAHAAAPENTPSVADPSNKALWWLELLERGPLLSEPYELRFCPRLLFYYGISNALLSPAYRFQYAFCERTLPIMTKARRWVMNAIKAPWSRKGAAAA